VGHLTTLLERTSKIFWLTFLGAFLFGAVLFSFLGFSLDPPQPIRFNHRKHVDAGIGCADCHTGVREQARATLPTREACLTCHEQEVTGSAEEKKLRDPVQAGQPLLWKQVTRLPPHVYFSHRRHVALAGMECGGCHGPMETFTEPPRRPFRPMTMKACQECHERMRAGNDCDDCHR